MNLWDVSRTDIKIFTQTAAALLFNTNSIYAIHNVDKTVTSRKDILVFTEYSFHFLVFYKTSCLKVLVLPSATHK